MLNFFASDGVHWGDAIDRWTISSDYGWFHVYAFTMTMGVIIAVGVSAIKLYVRKLPVMELMIATMIVVPCSLLGASFVGKLGKGVAHNFWEYFAFWEPGMAIHGGVLAGLIVGLIVFHFIGRFRTKVSMWTYADAIVPNILLGQAIGRWGNFFNHELHGYPVANITTGDHNPLTWLPHFIYTNTQFRYEGVSETTLNGIKLISGDVYQTEPIFLYESFGLVMVWIIVTFFIPMIGKVISKKPWKLFPDVYQLDMKYSFKVFFTHKREEGKMTYWEIWNDAFYHTYDEAAVSQYEQYFREHVIGQPWSLRRQWQNGVALEKANNPHHYLVAKSGIEAGAYFFGWNLVRFILELRRSSEDALITNDRTASLLIVGISFVLGIVLICLAQWVLPMLFRIPGYRYEKEYFFLHTDLVDEYRAEKQKLKFAKQQQKQQAKIKS